MSTNCIDCVTNKRTGTDLLCDLCRSLKVATREKNARIYYQDIVYAVCNVLDKVNGERVVCGTLETPTTQVAEAMTKMLARLRTAEAIVAKLPVTADKVPVVPGMELWFLIAGEPAKAHFASNAIPHNSECYYSTESAARAASPSPGAQGGTEGAGKP